MSNTPEAVSDKLNPTLIKTKDFSRSLFGYSPKEVITFLDTTAKNWEMVQRGERDLLDQLAQVQVELKTWKERESDLEKIKDRAEEEARAIKEEATKVAERKYRETDERALQVRKKTEDWLERVIEKVEEVKRQRQALRTSLRTTLDQHYSLLENEERAFGKDFTGLLEEESLSV